MTIKKVLAVFLVLTILLTFGACKSRSKDKNDRPKGARENVVVPENPRPEQDRSEEESSESSEEEESSEPEKDPIPEEMTGTFLGAVKSGVRENIQAYTDYNTMFKLAEGQGADWLLRQVLMRLNYEIISSEVEDDKAVVTAKVSNLDMNIVLPLYFEQAMAVSFENASERLGKTQEELDEEYRQVFLNLLSKYDNARIDRIVEIPLEKVGEDWKIKAGPEFGNMVLGGFLDAQDRVRGDMQQSEAEQSPVSQTVVDEETDEDKIYGENEAYGEDKIYGENEAYSDIELD